MVERSLVLSLFPGIGLLDRAFEDEGFCVVRGPDLLWGGDVKRFSISPGQFAGIIGGPPCQRFSSLSNINRARYGEDSLAEDLIPEFTRVVNEGQPDWFLMENVPRAPLPMPWDYFRSEVTLNNRWFGGVQHRVRRFVFGVRYPGSVSLRPFLQPEAFVPAEYEATATSTAGGRRRTARRDKRGQLQSAILLDRKTADLARLQGLPEGFLADAPFTEREKMRVISNGVPLPMGRAIASAVKLAVLNGRTALVQADGAVAGTDA